MSPKLPPVQWAQREDRVFVTFVVPDAQDVNVTFDAECIKFTCTSNSVMYSATINLLHPITSEKSVYKVHGGKVACCVFKTNATGEVWERLTKEPTRAVRHYVSVDWGLWKDPDEAEAMNNMDFDMSQFGNFGGGGDFPDSDDEEEPPADLADLDPSAAGDSSQAADE